MTAVGTGEIDYQSQLGAGVVDVLAFERTFTRLVGPHQSLVDVHQAVDRTTHGNYTPTSSTTNLHTQLHALLISLLASICPFRYASLHGDGIQKHVAVRTLMQFWGR